MEIYCAKCRTKTPTKKIHYETITTYSKAGNPTVRELAKGICANADATHKQQFISLRNSPASKQSKSGEGQFHKVDKKILSKQTYNALKKIAETNAERGVLKIKDKHYSITPVHTAKIKQLHRQNKLKDAAKVLAGEKGPFEIMQDDDKSGYIPIISDFLKLFGIHV